MAKFQTQSPGADPENPEVETVTVPATDLASLQKQIADLSRKLESAGKPRNRNSSDANLPDQADIDQATLKNPVLTKQGWLVPPEFGTNPNAPR